jgi:hypothetical protein
MHGFESRPRYEEYDPVSSNGRARGCYPCDGGSNPPAGALIPRASAARRCIAMKATGMPARVSRQRIRPGAGRAPAVGGQRGPAAPADAAPARWARTAAPQLRHVARASRVRRQRRPVPVGGINQRVLRARWSGRRPVKAEIAGSSPARTADAASPSCKARRQCPVSSAGERRRDEAEGGGSAPPPGTRLLW